MIPVADSKIVDSLKANQPDFRPTLWSDQIPVVHEPARSPATKRRLEGLDLARGIAITLMIISHTIKGLLSFEEMPDWGIMPVHTITKFSSSTFFLVFGIGLALYAHRPRTGVWRLIKRGLVILLVYKALTVVQMFQTFSRDYIIETLLFLRFPDFVEVLSFYALFLLWFPLLIPLWRPLGAGAKLVVVGLMAWAGHWLHLNFDFWGSVPLQTLLVEHPDHYTFGQLQRGAMVLFGWILGEEFLKVRSGQKTHGHFVSLLMLLSAACLAYFAGRAHGHFDDFLTAIARNHGKHPPSLVFLSFSIGGALAIIAACFWARTWLPRLLAPITLIGRWPLFSFSFHIVIVFAVYRYVFDLNKHANYAEAWMLTGALVAATAAVAGLMEWARRRT